MSRLTIYQVVSMLKKVPPKTFVALLFALLLLPAARVMAQPAPPQIESMSVALWPEFDQPDVLVVTHVQLAPGTTFPTQFTMQLPGYIEKMYAVAVESNGQLMNVAPEQINYRREGDNLFLTFPATEASIQLEYYDPIILTKDGVTRQLNYKFIAPANLAAVNFEVQQPADSQKFELTPAASGTFAGSNGLTYSSLAASNLAAGDEFTISATYQRPTNTLSAEMLPASSPAMPPPAPTIEAENTASSPYWGYGLLGAGVLLLVGTGGYWWRQSKKTAPAADSRRQPGRKNKRGRKNGGPTANYCFNCGAALREQAAFCHACGAEQRQN